LSCTRGSAINAHHGDDAVIGCAVGGDGILDLKTANNKNEEKYG
jgi:hypothetical protein